MLKNLQKTATTAVKSGLSLYAADKAVSTAGQVAVNFLPASVPVPASMLLAGLGLQVASESLGKGSMVKEFGEYCGAMGVVLALKNFTAIDKPVNSMLNNIKTIGMTDTAKAAFLAANSTGGYMKMNGYSKTTSGARISSMRGLTALHGF